MSTPRVLRIAAKDIYVTIEMPLDFLKNLAKVIDMSTFKYDSTNPNEVKMLDFLNEELYPFINGTIEGIEKQND